jgi:hypothetical protein
MGDVFEEPITSLMKNSALRQLESSHLGLTSFIMIFFKLVEKCFVKM